jgi:hypothetical protein
MAKVKSRTSHDDFEELPNIGPAMAGDLRLLGFSKPVELIGQDPYAMYDRLCELTNVRQDPCVYDVFIAVVRYMEGGPAVPWYKHTAERKAHLAGLAASRKPTR